MSARLPAPWRLACLAALLTPAGRGAEAEAWLRELAAPELPVRAAAAHALITSGSPETHPALLKALMDDEPLDHAIAARGLFARPPADPDAPALLRGLALGTKARVAAAWELARLGPTDDPAVARALIAALDHPDKHERNFVTLALAMTGAHDRGAIEALRRVLNDPGAEQPPQRNYRYPRATAAVVLGLIGPPAAEAARDLRAALDEPGSWEFQRAACRFALGRIDAGAPTGGAALTEEECLRALREAPPRASPEFLRGLRALGAYAGRAEPVPRKGSRRGTPAVHESIALALGYLDSLPRPPSPAEIDAGEKSGTLGAASMLHVMALGGVQQGIAETLLAALTEAERDPRVAAIRRLGAMERVSPPAITALRAALGDPDWVARREAFLALRRTAPR